MASSDANRRPMALRDKSAIQRLAAWLAARGVTPNAVSLLSVLCAALAGGCLVAGRWLNTPPAVTLLFVAPALVGLRGLCNLIDGLIAVEGGKQTKSGEVFNDVPDRVSDTLLFVGAGYGALEVAWGPALGWAASVLAVGTAYVRMLGGALTRTQDFGGWFAKPQRMAVISLASVAAGVERLTVGTTWSLVIGLAVIALGAGVTCWQRLRGIVRTLEQG